MSENLKNLIDGVEEDVKTRSELEYSVETLTEEIKKLNIKIEEQEKLLQQRESGAGDDLDIPDDIKILKEMIQTQREELIKKDHEIDSLKDIIIYADYGQLKEVFINIITNAYQAKKNNNINIFITSEYYEGKLL